MNCINNNVLKIKYHEYPRTIKILLFFDIFGFAIGTITHIIDSINHGIVLK